MSRVGDGVVVDKAPLAGFGLSCLLISPSSYFHMQSTLATRLRKRVFHLISLTQSISISRQQQQRQHIIRTIFQTHHLTPKMLHKRKRSSTTILSSPTSDLTGSTVQSFYPHTKPILSPFHSSPSKPSSFDPDTPSHLNIRTRKRHRDNRPDAESVHGAS